MLDKRGEFWMDFLSWNQVVIGVGCGGGVVLLLGLLASVYWIALAGAAAMLVAVALWAIFVRCPVCHKQIFYAHKCNYCHCCGEKLYRY